MATSVSKDARREFDEWLASRDEDDLDAQAEEILADFDYDDMLVDFYEVGTFVDDSYGLLDWDDPFFDWPSQEAYGADWLADEFYEPFQIHDPFDDDLYSEY